MVVIINPNTTGFILRLANSNASTPQIAAAGMTAHGTNVPPPTQIAAIWPNAVKVAIPEPKAVEKSFAMDPANEIPEKPEPSRPVIAPTPVRVIPAIVELTGTELAKAIPRSFTMP